MKNVHILPTDKPSKFYTCENELHFDNKAFYRDTSKNINITNDEEPKKGDYVIAYGEVVIKVMMSNKDTLFFVNGTTAKKEDSKKVILTTEQDLIKDGVQAINKDFLEWFVKNSSCEEVEVIDVRYDISTLTSDTEKYPNLDVSDYKIIIIPKEPKQETAVEWLEKKASNGFISPENFEEAKEMEMYQIQNAFNDGFDERKSGEQYYNEKFKK